MDARKLAILIALAAATLLFWYIAQPSSPAPARVEPPAKAVTDKVLGQSSAPAPVSLPASDGEKATGSDAQEISQNPAPAAPADLLPPPGKQIPLAVVQADLDEIQTTFRDFRTANRLNPVGTNAEITHALLGDNPKQLKLPLPPGSSLNAAGEMIDRWNTPYFFHQLSGTEMEIHSAGPDRKMWTEDDLVVK